MSFEYHRKNMGANSNEIMTNENIVSMQEFLEKEHSDNKSLPWNKLNKTNKNELIIKFANEYAVQNNLDNLLKHKLQTYLLECIKKNKISKKDIEYDSTEQLISSIPDLIHVNNKYLIKFKDNRVSTSKFLPKKILKKTIKKKDLNKESNKDLNKESNKDLNKEN